MTITQAVQIPASRRLVIDLPSEVPLGEAVITIYAPTRNDIKPKRIKPPLTDKERIDRAIKNASQGKNLVTFANIEEASRHALELAATKRKTELAAVK